MNRPHCLCTGREDIRCDDAHCDIASREGAPGDANRCTVCWKWLHSREHNLAWGGNGIVTPAVRPAKCRHRGDELGKRSCPDCPGDVRIKLFSCGIHGRCTIGKQVDGVACCAGCPDFRDESIVDEPGRIRHLLYHVFPSAVGGAIWRWNVEKLKRRMSLFNGRRVVGIAVDDTTEPASAVRNALAGFGCEFIEVANDPSLREVATFQAIHERVAEFTGPEHATFFGHTKGVTSEVWAKGARRWAEAMYSACLDHWPEARRLLVDHPLVGPFKRAGHLFPEAPGSSWHYSGSFRWFRNADVFGKPNWRDIDRVWVGAESWPSKHFSADDGAVLIGEFPQSGLALYTDEFWHEWATPAVANWHETHIADRWNPLILTCVLISHRKPGLVDEAIRSVQAQTSPDWRLVIVDSGELYEGLRTYEKDPRVSVVLSECGERCQGWQTNQAKRQGLITGDLVHYMTDDDVLSPNIFAAWIAAARSSPDQSAWYGPAERAEVRAGNHVRLGTLDAAAGERLNGRIDGIQACHRRCVTAPWPESEDRETRAHADGLFLDALQGAVKVHRIGEKVGLHRHTSVSEFTKSRQ